MKITYLHQYFNTPEMPGGSRSYEMARRLANKGHEVTVVTSWRQDPRGKDWFESDEAGVRVHWLPVPYSNNMSYAKRIRAFARFAVGAARRAGSIPADVVLATSTPLTIALPGVYAARRQKAPMVFEVRDLWPEIPIAVGALSNPIARSGAIWLERFAYSNATQVIALSPGMAEGVAAAGYPAQRITVIPNGADLNLFDPGAADPARFRRQHPEIGVAPLVVYTGTIGRINGVGYLAHVAAAALRSGSAIQFAVIGRGVEKEIIRAKAAELGVLGNNFHIYPPCGKQDVAHVLAAADLAVSTVVDMEVLWANCANKFFDAIASGTPVAVNYGGWQAELLQESGSGIVLPPDDATVAAERIIRFLADETAVEAAGLSARRLAESRFSWDHLADQLERALGQAWSDHVESAPAGARPALQRPEGGTGRCGPSKRARSPRSSGVSGGPQTAEQ